MSLSFYSAANGEGVDGCDKKQTSPLKWQTIPTMHCMRQRFLLS